MHLELHTTSRLGIDATKKIPGEGFKRPWPPLIHMDKNRRRKIQTLLAVRRSWKSNWSTLTNGLEAWVWQGMAFSQRQGLMAKGSE